MDNNHDNLVTTVDDLSKLKKGNGGWDSFDMDKFLSDTEKVGELIREREENDD